MSKQAQLPSFPDDLTSWLTGWFDLNYPDKSVVIDREEARAGALRALPFRLVPVGELAERWFVLRFQGVLRRNGYAFPEGKQGKTLVYQLELSFDELALLSIEQLEMARSDVEAVRARLVAWAEANDPALDVDDVFAEWTAAAGI